LNISLSSNVSETRKSIGKVLDGLQNTKQNLLEDVAEQIVIEAQNILRLNGNEGMGELLNSIKILESGIGTVLVGTQKDYAGYVEYGRGPVRPLSPDGVLHWVDRETGEDVFTKYSSPVEPSPFMAPAVESVVAWYKGIVAEKYNG